MQRPAGPTPWRRVRSDGSYASANDPRVLVGLGCQLTGRSSGLSSEIRWDDPTDAIPAFLTAVVMPLAVSITDGIAFGFISLAVLNAATGRARELDGLAYVFAAIFLLGYVLGLR